MSTERHGIGIEGDCVQANTSISRLLCCDYCSLSVSPSRYTLPPSVAGLLESGVYSYWWPHREQEARGYVCQISRGAVLSHCCFITDCSGCGYGRLHEWFGIVACLLRLAAGSMHACSCLSHHWLMYTSCGHSHIRLFKSSMSCAALVLLKNGTPLVWH